MKKILFAVFAFSQLFISSQTIVLQENFTTYAGTSVTVPAGWNFFSNGTYTTTTNSGTSGPNSYKFGVTNATISSPAFTAADTVHFWIRGNGVDTVSKLTVLESADSISWTAVAAIDHLPGSGTRYGFPLQSGTTHLRFTYTKSAGNLAFDDLVVIKNSVLTSAGSIKIYFNHPVDASVSTGQNAIYLNQSVDDTLISYINRAKYTLDIAVYNYVQSANISSISSAINNAYARGVKIRWIYDGNSSNSGLTQLNSGIPTLISPVSGAYGIMHNKFMVVDANSINATDALVWTGSCNWTDEQINSDFNNIVIIQNKDLAQAYRTEFNEMWGDTGMVADTISSRFGPYKSDNTPHFFNIGGINVECYFSPSDATNSHIMNVVNGANDQLFFGMYTFTSQINADSIKNKILNQGVYCAGILDASSTGYSPYATLYPVMGNLIKLYPSTPSSVYHNKFMIVDPCNLNSDPAVETGSHNWTAGADTKNDENTLIIHDATIANLYYQSFYSNFNYVGGTLTACALIAETNENSFSGAGIKIFPNPSSDFFIVENPGSKLNSVTLYDLNGKKLISEKNCMADKIKIDTGFLKEGVYFVEVNSDSGVQYKKIVLQR